MSTSDAIVITTLAIHQSLSWLARFLLLGKGLEVSKNLSSSEKYIQVQTPKLAACGCLGFLVIALEASCITWRCIDTYDYTPCAYNWFLMLNL